MKKTISLIFVILVLILAFVGWNLFGTNVKQPEKKYFYIYSGDDYEKVKSALDDQKIISGKMMFDLASKIAGYKKIIPGRYEIKDGSSLISLVRMLKNGRQSIVNLVITKLRTKEDLAKKLGKQFEFDSLQMMNFLNNADSLKTFGLDTNTVMTAIIPNTYSIKWNTTPGKVLRKLYSESQKFWTSERKQKADSLGLTPTQVYIFASIVEEETNIKADKYNIASVYLNRYKKGMNLQACPTIKFAMKNFSLTRIYDKYLQIESPYNTYRNKGLPPGPICTPQPETIDEVLNAPKTGYLYFVANSDLKGGTLFSSDYKKHLKLAKEYQEALDKRETPNQ